MFTRGSILNFLTPGRGGGAEKPAVADEVEGLPGTTLERWEWEDQEKYIETGILSHIVTIIIDAQVLRILDYSDYSIILSLLLHIVFTTIF